MDRAVTKFGTGWWNPDRDGRSIEGTIIKIRGARAIPHYDVRRDNGTRATLSIHSQLINELIEAQATIGDRIYVEFRGMGKGVKSKKMYHVYRVKVEYKSRRRTAKLYDNIEKLLDLESGLTGRPGD